MCFFSCSSRVVFFRTEISHPGFLLADSFYSCEVPKTRSATPAGALLVLMLRMAFESLRKLMPKCHVMMPLRTAPWWNIGFTTTTASITSPLHTNSFRHHNFQISTDIYRTGLVLCSPNDCQGWSDPMVPLSLSDPFPFSDLC